MGDTPPEAMCERLDAATPSQIERANAAVQANLDDDGSPKSDSAQGYACALTAVMQAVDLIQQQQATIERLSAAKAEAVKAAYLEGYDHGWENGQSISGNTAGCWETSKARNALGKE